MNWTMLFLVEFVALISTAFVVTTTGSNGMRKFFLGLFLLNVVIVIVTMIAALQEGRHLV